MAYHRALPRLDHRSRTQRDQAATLQRTDSEASTEYVIGFDPGRELEYLLLSFEGLRTAWACAVARAGESEALVLAIPDDGKTGRALLELQAERFGFEPRSTQRPNARRQLVWPGPQIPVPQP